MLEVPVCVPDQDTSHDNQQHAGCGAENTDERLELVHSFLQLYLFLFYLRVGIAEEELIVFMQDQGAAVDHEHDEHQGYRTPEKQKHLHRRHSHLASVAELGPTEKWPGESVDLPGRKSGPLLARIIV